MKEIIGHLCDAERVQSYRALRFARGDQKELQGFEQDDYVREAHSDARSLNDLLDEFEGIRNSTVALFKSFRRSVWQRSGVANGAPVTVRAMAYIIAGHTQHHYDCVKARWIARQRPDPSCYTEQSSWESLRTSPPSPRA